MFRKNEEIIRKPSEIIENFQLLFQVTLRICISFVEFIIMFGQTFNDLWVFKNAHSNVSTNISTTVQNYSKECSLEWLWTCLFNSFHSLTFEDPISTITLGLNLKIIFTVWTKNSKNKQSIKLRPGSVKLRSCRGGATADSSSES